MAHEEWRDVVGYEGLYQVSNLGRVRSLDRFVRHNNGGARHLHGKIMKQNPVYGYYSLCLCKDGSTSTFRVHRLVAEAFIPNDENKQFVDHINGNRADNRVSNLRWATPKENHDYAVDAGSINHHSGSSVDGLRRFNRERTCAAVIRDDGIRYESIAQAARANDVPASNISRALKRTNLKVRGHRYRYESYTQRIIQQIDLETGLVINTFNSIREAAKHVSSVRAISSCINGRTKTAAGYKWTEVCITNCSEPCN